MPSQKTTKDAAPMGFDDMAGNGADGSALATQAPPVAQRAVEFTTAPQFESNEISLPRLRLAQGLTAEVTNGEARPGQWVLSGHQAEAQVHVIPIMFARSRKRADKDNQTLCQSPDAVQGYGDPGVKCATCPFAQWTDDGSRRKAPDCNEVKSYACWSITHQAIVKIDFQRTAIPVAQLINTIIQARGLGNFALTMGAMPKQGPRGTFHSPTAILAKNVSPEDMEMARSLMGMGGAQVVDEVPDQDVIDVDSVTAG